MNDALKIDFGFTKPRIAVLGLNPHAGDSGLIGKEEMEIIEPAIKKARDEGIMVMGPFPTDGFFGSGNQKKYDGVLAMYHDQALPTFKALGFHEGVNFTAGLPVIRTSPVHGTAFEIAGKNEASPDSFRHAMYLAADIHKRRLLHRELTSDPLKHHNLNDEDGA
jgi:4-hydroxythreonine-4-phosphate dehydrogenase